MEENKRPGFRIGNYFVTFPQEDFIREDGNDGLFVELDIFKIDEKNIATQLTKTEVTPEIENMIVEEITKMIKQGLDILEKKDDENERD